MEPGVAKAITSVVLFVITVVLGVIPRFIVRHGHGAPSPLRDKVLSWLTCFSGGVFLGTCLLHLFVEGRDDLNGVLDSSYNFTTYPVFELLAGTGFFLMALVEQLTLLCLAGVVAGTNNDNTNNNTTTTNTTRDSCSNKRRKSGCYVISDTCDIGRNVSGANYTTHTREENGVSGESVEMPTADDEKVKVTSDKTVTVEIVEEIHNSHSHHAGVISNVSGVRAFLLLMALSFHTIFDGLAVGLQEKVEDVWGVFAAITVHKSVMAFCLGLELFTAFRHGCKRAIAGLLLFSIMSPLGIGIGIAITSPNVDGVVKNLTSGVLQAVAGGSFLYITCFEILQGEIGLRGSVLKVLIVVAGFSVMAGIKAMDSD